MQFARITDTFSADFCELWLQFAHNIPIFIFKVIVRHNNVYANLTYVGLIVGKTNVRIVHTVAHWLSVRRNAIPKIDWY